MCVWGGGEGSCSTSEVNGIMTTNRFFIIQLTDENHGHERNGVQKTGKDLQHQLLDLVASPTSQGLHHWVQVYHPHCFRWTPLLVGSDVLNVWGSLFRGSVR